MYMSTEDAKVVVLQLEENARSSDLLLFPRFTCENCGRTYKHRSNLCNHKREECGKLPSYFCPICQKGFKKKQHLQRHLAVHADWDSPVGRLEFPNIANLGQNSQRTPDNMPNNNNSNNKPSETGLDLFKFPYPPLPTFPFPPTFFGPNPNFPMIPFSAPVQNVQNENEQNAQNFPQGVPSMQNQIFPNNARRDEPAACSNGDQQTGLESSAKENVVPSSHPGVSDRIMVSTEMQPKQEQHSIFGSLESSLNPT